VAESTNWFCGIDPQKMAILRRYYKTALETKTFDSCLCDFLGLQGKSRNRGRVLNRADFPAGRPMRRIL